jgi:hypothetical protein
MLIEAALWLGLARPAVLIMPFRLSARVLALRPAGEEGPADANAREAARQTGWALRAAAARMPWKCTCLAQALAGAAMLRCRGIPATLAMGVARNAGEEIEAHAWLSCAGLILTGAGGHERFRVVARFAARSGQRQTA